MTCPFCDSKQRILKENDLAYVMLSNPRRMEGHFLVIPKRHIEIPTEITNEEIVDVFELVKFLQGKLIGTLGEGTQVRQNYMPYVPDSKYKVAHMHYHVMPRSLNDKMFQVVETHDRETFEDLTDEEHDRVAKLLE